MRTLTINLGERSYPIHIGQGVLADKNLLSGHIAGKQILVVSNTTIAPLLRERMHELLAGQHFQLLELPDGEAYKTPETLNDIYRHLLTNHYDRQCVLIALGGGVVGDITGFAAATYQRGVDYIQIPTTLLAQVDSSVGGKTAVNHPLGKNMIGAFHQPRCVLTDTDVLNTLPPRELSAGMAEIIKYGLIRDTVFLSWLEQNIQGLMNLETDKLIHAVEQSCRIKAQVVSEDEREQGVRAILNLGHTFGHAIETHTGYGRWLHGEAVGAGMVMAAEFSRRCGWMNDKDVTRTRALIEAAGLPTAPPADMTAEIFLQHMRHDKKVEAGVIRLVLLQSLGQAVVTRDYDEKQLYEFLTEAHTL